MPNAQAHATLARGRAHTVYCPLSSVQVHSLIFEPIVDVMIFFSVFINFINFLCSSNALVSAVSLRSICFCLSNSFNFLAYSVFFVMMYCRMASLSNKNPSFLLIQRKTNFIVEEKAYFNSISTYVTTGIRHGCSVNEQQSKLFTESLPMRRWFVP